MTMWLECHSVRATGALQELNLLSHINCSFHTLAGCGMVVPTQIPISLLSYFCLEQYRCCRDVPAGASHQKNSFQ